MKAHCLPLDSSLKWWLPQRLTFVWTYLAFLALTSTYYLLLSQKHAVLRIGWLPLTCVLRAHKIIYSKQGSQSKTRLSNCYFSCAQASSVRLTTGSPWRLMLLIVNTVFTTTFLDDHNIFFRPDPAAVQHINPFYQVVSENDSFNIFCNATGNPTPIITWLKMGVHISVGQKVSVTRAQLKDNGKYDCFASNGIGTPSTASVDVVVNGKYSQWLLAVSHSTVHYVICFKFLWWACIKINTHISVNDFYLINV